MYTVVIIGTGFIVGIIRCYIYKKNKNSNKIQYYNYSKYAVKYKRLNNNINQQSKNIF
ncbi:hypothetical protein [Clostridium rectalis]|uniref:hypothetical protein n=1 Tax=Clostridium rectalis TaxID=2040295 RepID=UPI0013DE1DC8|nr:hypothetical protein [Clostridium rectalis]